MILTLTPHIVYSKVCALAQTKLNILYLLFKLVKPMSLGRNETRRKLILPRQILYFSQFHNSEFPFKMTLEKEKKEKAMENLDIKSIKAIGTLPRGTPLEERSSQIE